jgi:hypothetical protein
MPPIVGSFSHQKTSPVTQKEPSPLGSPLTNVRPCCVHAWTACKGGMQKGAVPSQTKPEPACRSLLSCDSRSRWRGCPCAASSRVVRNKATPSETRLSPMRSLRYKGIVQRSVIEIRRWRAQLSKNPSCNSPCATFSVFRKSLSLVQPLISCRASR